MEEQFRRAASEGDLPTVQWILQQPDGGFNVNAGNERGFTPLHVAVLRGHLAIVQAILQVEGVNLNVRNIAGTTPLHWVCLDSSNALLMTQALLEAGADPNAADSAEGNTPLYLAAQLDRIAVLEAMLDGGANPAVRNNDLDTPLHIACRYGRLDAAQLLMRRQGSECLTVEEYSRVDSTGLFANCRNRFWKRNRRFHSKAYSTGLRRNDSSARRSSLPSFSSPRYDIH